MPPASPAPSAAWAGLPGRSTLLVHGPDAVRFVDHFTTAALSRLDPGHGSETFFTDARGHVIALVNVLRTATGLWIDAPPGVAERLRAHLEHFVIREHVEFEDATPDRGTLLLAGPGARDWLAAHVAGAVPGTALDHAPIRVGDVDVHALALDWFGAGGLLLHGTSAAADRLTRRLRDAGLTEIDAANVDALRIAAGSPEPVDIDAKTLPQELARDARAISFTKGCYLGQETVARIDALGHVNRRLVILATETSPAAGTPVTAADETVGRVTSGCTIRDGGGLGLALVLTRALDGRPLTISGSPARVVPAPHPAATEGA